MAEFPFCAKIGQAIAVMGLQGLIHMGSMGRAVRHNTEAKMVSKQGVSEFSWSSLHNPLEQESGPLQGDIL